MSDRGGFLSVKGVAALVGLSPASIWRLVRGGGFPKPISLETPKRTVWLRAEVLDWCDQKVAYARGGAR